VLAASAWAPGQPGLWEEQAYETHVEFHMPYMNFMEDIYIHADERSGLMRLSYYSGANVFLCNTSGPSFELIPIVDTLSCLYTPTVKTLERVLPDLSTFLNLGTWREVDLVDSNGLYSIGFEFTLQTGAPAEHGKQNWKYFDTETPAKFQGKYTFIVNATAGGAPVNLTFVGHNVFLVNSHYDEYSIVYRGFYPRAEGIDQAIFRPPRGMPCKEYGNTQGPFRKGPLMQSRPLAALRDLAMALPTKEGVAHQDEVAESLEQHVRQHAGADASELSMRREVAKRHFRWIQASNRRGLPYRVGVNHMVTWLPHERSKLCGKLKTPKEDKAKDLVQKLVALNVGDHCGELTGHYEVHSGLKRTGVSATNADLQLKDFGSAIQLDAKSDQTPEKASDDALQSVLPLNLDLREKGLVTPVKDQGTCGSCWTFGAMGAIEGQYAKASGKLTVMAEQQLVDCTWSAGNLGCDGGNDFSAFSWLMQENGGKFQPESVYGTYISQDGFCHLKDIDNAIYAQITQPTELWANGVEATEKFDQSKSVVACSHVVSKLAHSGSAVEPVMLDGVHRNMAEEAMIDMLKLVLMVHGPTSVSIEATHNDFYYYASGVYNDPACSPFVSDHIVVLTGYGTDSKLGMDYWLLKNSWSTHWGENGFIRTARKGNVCGVATNPVIVHLG
jgi:hypothetical protein